MKFKTLLQFNLQQFACACDQGNENLGENEEQGTSPVAVSSSRQTMIYTNSLGVKLSVSGN
jgi:hypothetical protein